MAQLRRAEHPTGSSRADHEGLDLREHPRSSRVVAPDRDVLRPDPDDAVPTAPRVHHRAGPRLSTGNPGRHTSARVPSGGGVGRGRRDHLRGPQRARSTPSRGSCSGATDRRSSAPPSSRSWSRGQSWRSPACGATGSGAPCVGTGGSSCWDAAWCIHRSSRTAGTTPSGTPASRSGWGSIASRSCKYRIPDIRMLVDGDIRFLAQFGATP